MRIVAIGPENFFADRWNNLDSFLIILAFIFFWLPVSDGASSLAQIGRIFRIAGLLRIISRSSFTDTLSFRFFVKLKTLFQVLL